MSESEVGTEKYFSLTQCVHTQVGWHATCCIYLCWVGIHRAKTVLGVMCVWGVAGWLAGSQSTISLAYTPLTRSAAGSVLSVSGSRSSPPGVVVCCGLTSAREEGEA